MKYIEKYKNKKVLVLGLARSGVSAAQLLHKLGALVTVNDYKVFEDNPEAQQLLDQGIRVVTGGHPIELLDEDFFIVVKNPGINYENPIVKKTIENKIPVITEIQLAYEIAECPIIGITGTNGKTTTTSMVTDLLNSNRKEGRAYAAGNIGTPASLVGTEVSSKDDIVMELSSFQLLGITSFRPHIAIITNIFSAHLDYHGTREEYVAAKMNIMRNQTEADYLIVNWDLPELRELVKGSRATIIPFSRKQVIENGVYLKDNTIFFKGELIMQRESILVPGNHNVENALAAIAVAKLYNKSNDTIKNTFLNFSGVEYRTQYIGEYKKRRFYNDSKATNTLATITALNGFSAPIILLAGGLDRGNDFDDLIPHLKNVKALVVFGETSPKLTKTGEEAGVKTIISAGSVEKAVPISYQLSEEGDIILLSPACASWDQYRNFEKRGEAFTKAVQLEIKKQEEEV
ncbi:MAG: UDP-N-acetylmuramoyl-L-alanine--D-glutamate ligase [Pisciglobus halotolerans]|nr:UDP-N-acetylmuramoyl-L-alanine--D-glutamate ligase [Pisciglobus halotolerans]